MLFQHGALFSNLTVRENIEAPMREHTRLSPQEMEELADLKDKYPSRLALHHVLSREQRIAPLLSGRIDAEKLQALLGTAIHADDVDEWFLCGPFELVQLCRDTLAERGVNADHVRFELFSRTGVETEPAPHQYGEPQEHPEPGRCNDPHHLHPGGPPDPSPRRHWPRLRHGIR